MTAQTTRFGMITGATALAILLGGWVTPVTAATVTDENVVEQVQDAKTAEDHEALAAYFNAKAAAAAANVKKHRAMMSVMRGKPRSPWRGHCQNLVKTYQKQQEDYAALAKEQQKLAKTAGKPGMQHGM